MLADSFLPNTFWAEAVITACYVLNRVLVTKPHNKTPYELITGKQPIISYIRPFGCHVTILNTIDHLGKFEEKDDEENKPNVARKGPTWLFDLDYLTDSMNYQPVTAENKANKTAGPIEANESAGTQDDTNVGNSEVEAEPVEEHFVLPFWPSYSLTIKSSETKNKDAKPNEDTTLKTNEEPVDQSHQIFLEELKNLKRQEKEANDASEILRKEFAQITEYLLHQAGAKTASSTNHDNTASITVNTASTTVNTVSTPINIASSSKDVRATKLSYPDPSKYVSQDVSQIPDLEDIHEVPKDGLFTSASYDDEGVVTDFTNLETFVDVCPIARSRIHSVHPTSQILGDPKSAVQTRSKVDKGLAHALIEPKKISEALEEESLIDAMQEELLHQEEGIDYDEIFAPVARIEAIMIFLAFSSYMGFIVYQMDVKSVFLYSTIDEEVYVSQPPGFIDPKYPNKVYKVKQKEDGIFISQDKYVAEILKKFDFMSVKLASTPIETYKLLVKDEEATDVDVHLYWSMIGFLMYLTASRPDIMYLKDKPKLGLWYPRESSFDLVAYSDSDYGGANLDRKSTTGGCQFLSHRLISWQCKKQTIVATSATEAEYVAAANYCRKVLWIQN
ncbi:putative ribonuclease H-like domain-containing protein [Tanacetum coccineum]